MLSTPLAVLLNAASHDVPFCTLMVPALLIWPTCENESLVKDQPAVELMLTTPPAWLLKIAAVLSPRS